MPWNEKTLPPLTRVQIARYAGAVRDFNPIHVDEEFAKTSGMPSVIAHGPLTLARALDAIVAQVGAGAVKGVDARLKAPYTPGETLTVVPVDGGFELRNGSGTVLITGTLTLNE
ncbi:MAG: MaoC/PaaZ C-terminal domain-containing protein [Actinomycetota bacterium]